MHARVATFQSDPAKVDDAIEIVRDMVAGEAAEGLEGTKMLMLVDRRSNRARVLVGRLEDPLPEGLSTSSYRLLQFITSKAQARLVSFNASPARSTRPAVSSSPTSWSRSIPRMS
jgi:hypothetical protein